MITGRQIGGYEIQEELGRGAMGVVFKARQVSMDRIVAIKFLPKRLAQDERIVARFLREARAAGQLSHPNIVSVHELGMADGLHFIAMEFVDGNSIQKKLKEKGPFSEKEALEVAGQIAEALKMAHSRGILHRDIKPDNFLVDSAGRVRLADLGLASIESSDDGSLTQDGTTLGTPHFMSPEQCSGSGTDVRSDLYSLGASLFVMSTGRTPYEGTTAAAVMVKVLTEAPASLKKVRPELSAGFVALVEKLMQKDPARRFQNASEAAEAIQLCKSGLYKAVVMPSAPAAKSNQKSTPVKNAAGSALKPNELASGARASRSEPSKLIPLLLGGGAALALIVVLAVYKSRTQPQQQPVAPVLGKVDQPLVRGTMIETSGASNPSVIVKPVDDPKTPAHPILEKPFFPNSPAAQFQAIDDALTSGRMKLGEAAQKVKEFRAKHQVKLESPQGQGLLRRLGALEREISKREEVVALEWKKLDAATTGPEAKLCLWSDALPKLAQFKTEHEGLEEALKAGEKIDAIVGAQLAFAKRMADGNNPRDAAAQLTPMIELAALPEKQLAELKAAVELYNARIKSGRELAEVYEEAWGRVLLTDKLEKKKFTFSDAVKFCNESASKARFDENKKDLNELARLFDGAKHAFSGLREQINAGRTVELPNLPGFFKSRVTVVKWGDEEISFTPADISQPQPLSLYSASAPEAILAIAQEARKYPPSASNLWDVGLLALAFGNPNLAGKYAREAAAKDDTLASKPQYAVVLKLLKPIEVALPKAPDKLPDTVVPLALNREKDAEQCLKDLQDALKAGDKTKIAASRVELASKFADTEFFKSHKKEIDELLAATPAVAVVVEPPKVAPVVPDRVKPDTRSPQEKEAQEALAKLGWPAENVMGNWTLDKQTHTFKVDGGISELSIAALDADIDIKFQFLDPMAKLRVLTRVEKTLAADRFASFGADKGAGFGADISGTNVYVYLDLKNLKIPQLYKGTNNIASWRQPHHIYVRHRDGQISVTFDDEQPKKNAGDARNTGEIRIIVQGPMQLVPKLINPAKM